MVIGRTFIQNPGPTNIPDRILRAMAAPPVDFGTQEFLDLLDGCLAGVNDLMGNGSSTDQSGRIIGYTSNGHGAWEAVATNLFAEGDRVLLCDTGLFSSKWADLLVDHRIDVQRLVTGERDGVDPAEVRRILEDDTDQRIAGVLLCHTETSTGITSDLDAIRHVLDDVGHRSLFVVDAIASFLTTPLEMVRQGVDVVMAASQKGLMMPVGLSFSAVSERAIERAYSCERPRHYWDWRIRLEEEGYRKFCGTPPIHHLFALRVALDIVAEQGGVGAVWERHERLAEAVRCAVDAWSTEGAVELNAKRPEERAAGVTCIRVAEGVDSAAIVTTARERFNVTLGAGVGDLAGRAFRIGHMGDLNEAMILGALGGVELALRASGVPIGSGGLDAASAALSR